MAWFGWALVWLDAHEKLNYQVSLLTLDGGEGGEKLKLRLNLAWAELGKIIFRQN